MLASKLVLVCLFLEFALVGSVYEPVRLDDIKKLVFRKYEKTDGNYRISAVIAFGRVTSDGRFERRTRESAVVEPNRADLQT